MAPNPKRDFTKDDRAFLKSLRISPEMLDMDTVRDIMMRPGRPPTNIIISAELATKIVSKYGELNFDNYWAYRLAMDKDTEGTNGK